MLHLHESIGRLNSNESACKLARLRLCLVVLANTASLAQLRWSDALT
jgi:hypothetical protein